MSELRTARPAPAGWTRWYWPTAVAISVAGFVASPAHLQGAALLFGAIVILVPELWSVITRNFQNTLSDWTWRVLQVTANQPLRDWSAVHFLAFGAYIALAVRVCLYLWQHANGDLAAAATVVAAWLVLHLFAHWWI